MKNNIDYFTHDSHSHEHAKFKMLRVGYGWEWYWRFWALNEIIAQSEDCRLDLSQKYNKASLASDLGLNLKELEEFINFLIEDCNLLLEKDWKISTDRVQIVFEKVMNERNRCKSKRKQGSTEGRPENNLGKKENDRGQISQSKVKESKGKETKVKEKKAVISFQEILKQEMNEVYLKEKAEKHWGADKILKELQEFIDYWTETKHWWTKQLWQMKKTFDVRRRFWKWLSNDFGGWKTGNLEKRKIAVCE